MKVVSYILAGVAVVLAAISLIVYYSETIRKRALLIDSLQKARDVKAAKKAAEEDPDNQETKKQDDNDSKKEKT